MTGSSCEIKLTKEALDNDYVLDLSKVYALLKNDTSWC